MSEDQQDHPPTYIATAAACFLNANKYPRTQSQFTSSKELESGCEQQYLDLATNLASFSIIAF
jgi:hypothetical protein